MLELTLFPTRCRILEHLSCNHIGIRLSFLVVASRIPSMQSGRSISQINKPSAHIFRSSSLQLPSTLCADFPHRDLYRMTGPCTDAGTEQWKGRQSSQPAKTSLRYLSGDDHRSSNSRAAACPSPASNPVAASSLYRHRKSYTSGHPRITASAHQN